MSEDELKNILEGLDTIFDEWEEGKFELLPSDEDIHTANERRLCDLIGKNIGGKLHTGRSRNDQVQTDVHLWLKRAISEISSQIEILMKTFCQRSSENLEILMPSYTHFQPAQIIRFSHWYGFSDYLDLLRQFKRYKL